MAHKATGHVEQLPSGSFRVSVYAGYDSQTGRRRYLRDTAKSIGQAQVVLGKLIEQASVGRQPESTATVAQLLEQYLVVVDWDLSTRESNEGYIRRTILPGLGKLQLRKVRGPVLDGFYARLRRCGDPACTGKPFTEHSAFPELVVDRSDARPAWQQVADAIREAVAAGQLVAGDHLPSVREIASQQGVRMSTLQHALAALAGEGVIDVRQGRRAAVASALSANAPAPSKRLARPRHDCARVGCRPHRCRPMTAKTIRNIHSILSGAFAAAVRWEWIDRNPAESAKLPKVPPRRPASPSREIVAKVVAAARGSDTALAVYLWLAAITGARRGELCGLQWGDVDLTAGTVRMAFGYLVRGGQRLRKDTKTHQERTLAIDPVTCALLREHKEGIEAGLARVGVGLAATAYVFSNDPVGERPWNPDWATHKVGAIARAAGAELNIKALRHYTASQLLAGGIDIRNTAARLGHGSGGATTLRHYADPVSEVDRRAAAYLAKLTAPSVNSADPAAGATS